MQPIYYIIIHSIDRIPRVHPSLLITLPRGRALALNLRVRAAPLRGILAERRSARLAPAIFTQGCRW